MTFLLITITGGDCVSVVFVRRWFDRQKDYASVEREFKSLNRFIRSRIIPPPIGSATFTFRSGSVILSGPFTRIVGKTCEILMSESEFEIVGDYLDAYGMVKEIENEIKGIPASEASVAVF